MLDINLPSISENYIKSNFKIEMSIKEVNKEIKKLSEILNSKEGDVKCSFLIKTLKMGMFFKFEKEIYENLFFDSVLWAVKNEDKRKKRYSNALEIKEDKSSNLTIKLLSSIIININNIKKENNIESLSHILLLERFISLFYEALKQPKQKKKEDSSFEEYEGDT